MEMVRRQRLPRRITVVVGLVSLCGIFFVPFHLGSVPFHLGSVSSTAPPEQLLPLTALAHGDLATTTTPPSV